uniref:Uncharacterized protein n=1 Tax=Glossina palpalis gambiensis TaxID=67801 RepID=A0A1B0AYI0_9MUSC
FSFARRPAGSVAIVALLALLDCNLKGVLEIKYAIKHMKIVRKSHKQIANTVKTNNQHNETLVM